MINPIRLCNDLFDDPQLSDSSLQIFTEDALLRLTNNNPGAIYSTLISDTTIKYTAYYGQMSSEATQVAIREGLTINKNDARRLAEEKLSSLQGLVKFKFGDTSATYQEFYPQGMDEYYQARDGELQIIFDRYKAACTTHLTADFPAEVAAVDTLVGAFKAAYTAQKNAFSNIDNVITGKNEDRKALTMQLTRNFLIIASDHVDDTDKFDDFFNPQYLPIRVGTSDSGTIITREGDVAASGMSNIDFEGITGTVKSSVVLLATGSTLRFYASATTDGLPAPETPFIEVLPGESVSMSAEDFIAQLGLNDTNKYLNVQNVGLAEGHYKATFYHVEIEE